MRIMFILALFIFFGSFSVQQDLFDELFSLNGNWKMESKRGTVYESWRKISDKELRGISYRMLGRDTLLLEEVKLCKFHDGIFYIPIVNDQHQGQPDTLRLTTSANRVFSFENNNKVFPKRITYHVVGKDSIHGWTEETRNGKPWRSDVYLKKAN